MSDSAPIGIIWAHCNRCYRQTRHSTVAEHQERQEHDGAGVWWLDEYKIIKCEGCEAIHFVHRSIFSEEAYGEEEYWDWKSAEYPPRIARQPPSWLQEIEATHPEHFLYGEEWPILDEALAGILSECYAALHQGSRMLAAMGARAAFERLMILKIGDRGTFNANIEQFIAQGYLQENLKTPLLDAIGVGHAAMHRGYAPTDDVLFSLFDILEGVISSTLVLPDRAKKVQKVTPPRITKSKTKETP